MRIRRAKTLRKVTAQRLYFVGEGRPGRRAEGAPECMVLLTPRWRCQCLYSALFSRGASNSSPFSHPIRCGMAAGLPAQDETEAGHRRVPGEVHVWRIFIAGLMVVFLVVFFVLL